MLKRSFDLYCDHDYRDSWVTEWTDLVPATDKEDGYGHKKVWCRYCRTVKYDKMATIGKVSECSINPARKTFDGETVNPEDIHVYAYGSDMKNENGSVTAHMKYGEDYTVTFPDGMKEIGAYPVIFTGMGKYDFRITIYFEIVPETPRVEAHNAASGIKVTWSEPVNEISGYYIYKRTYSGKYSKIKTINDISVRSYIDTDVIPGVDYVYTVRAFWKDSSGRAVLSGYAGDGERCLNPPSVDVSFGANGPSVTWNKISGARIYFVYRKESGTAKWKKIAEVESELSYTDTAAVIGKEYYYTVRAYYRNFNFYHESMSAYKSSEKLTCLSCPAVTIANAATGVKVSYDKIAGANGYYIYRKVSGGSYRKVKEITNGSTVSWTDTGAASGTNYVYTVKACYKDGDSGKVATSTYRGSNTLKYLKCPSVTLSRLSTGIKVSWDKVGGAASYRLYRKQEGAASWTRIKDISNGTTVSYTDTTARKGVKYYYTVRALNGSYISAYVTNKSITR